MVIHLPSKMQVNKFVEQSLVFKVRVKSTYTNVWHDTKLSERQCFNCQQFGNRSESYTRPTVYDNCAVSGYTYI